MLVQCSFSGWKGASQFQSLKSVFFQKRHLVVNILQNSNLCKKKVKLTTVKIWCTLNRVCSFLTYRLWNIGEDSHTIFSWFLWCFFPHWVKVSPLWPYFPLCKGPATIPLNMKTSTEIWQYLLRTHAYSWKTSKFINSSIHKSSFSSNGGAKWWKIAHVLIKTPNLAHMLFNIFQLNFVINSSWIFQNGHHFKTLC